MKINPLDLITDVRNIPVFRGTSRNETARPGKWWTPDKHEASYNAGTGTSYEEGANVMMALLNAEGFPKIDVANAAYDNIPIRAITDSAVLQALEAYHGSKPWDLGYVTTYELAQAIEHARLPGLELKNVGESTPHQFYVADATRAVFPGTVP